METSQILRKGERININTRSKPQKYWESFSPVAGIPKDMKRVILVPTKKT
jgi:hypothetical protein